MFIYGNVENLFREINKLRNGLMQLLSWEVIYKEEADEEKKERRYKG